MSIKRALAFISISLFSSLYGFSQTPSPTPTPRVVGEVVVTDTRANTDPVYQQLRKLSDAQNSFSGEYVTVGNFVLKRDEGTFSFRSGEFYFLNPIEGRTTGAVFIGNGEFYLNPPVESERKMMQFFTESPDFREQFSQLVMFFTDDTAELIKSSPGAKAGNSGPQAEKARDTYRFRETVLKKQLRYNVSTRVLMDIYAPPRRGFFAAFIDGLRHNKLLYLVDPLGLEQVAPEQVMLLNYSSANLGIWSAFHLAEEYKKGTAKGAADRTVFDIVHHEMDVTIQETKISARDTVTMTIRKEGQRVLPFNFFPRLKVLSISDSEGTDVPFIQESREDEGDLAIILPKSYPVGQPFKLSFTYEGDGALIKAGGGTYYLGPRSTWYPNNGGIAFGDRATFDIKFRYSKKLTLVGVGELVEPERVEGENKIAHWSSKETELKVAGFNLGDFVKKEITDPQAGYLLEVYVNTEVPDEVKVAQNIADLNASRGGREANIGSINTQSMATTILADTQNAARIYNGFFGKLPYKRIAMTQQPAGNFGQAWPTLIYMPYVAFLTPSQRTILFGQRNANSGFWTEVGAHEFAHQWWGHLIGWNGYHEQWMSEGFSEFSSSLYILFVKKDVGEFNKFWDSLRKQIVEPNPQTNGIKPYTVGPVTQGYRLSSGKAGNVTRFLIYPKGAYILQMLRMLMKDRVDGDAKFGNMMRDFIKMNYNKDITTEDFKAAVEKHMTPEMDIDKNKKMDWFFDQWVYGTEMPAYKFEYSLSTNAAGKPVINGKITQSEVSNNFVMPMPIYLDFGQGWVELGKVTIVGNNSIELKDIELPMMPKKAAISALSDVLASKIENVTLKK
jgi:hypothetical protein